MKLIILAAGKSKRIYKHIRKNKCLIKVNNLTLIQKIIQDSSNYFNKVIVVTGYNSQLIKRHLRNYSNIKIINNKKYKTTEMLYSLIMGLKYAKDNVVISYSDILVSKKIWQIFKNQNKDEIFVPIKKDWKNIWKIRSKLFTDDAETLKINKTKYLMEIGNKIKDKKDVDGQFMGLIYIPKKFLKKIINLYTKHKFRNMQTTQFMNFLIKKKYFIKCKLNNLFWYEIDDIDDLKNLKKK